MGRWFRIIRGMIRMGLTFSVGVGVVASAIAGLVWLLPGGGGARELARVAVACSIWAFPIGVAFSGVLALSARGRTFERLSLPRFSSLGAGAGLLLFGVLAARAWDTWSLNTAMANAAIFVFLGSGSATATLILARKAGPALDTGDDSPLLDPGDGPPEEGAG